MTSNHITGGNPDEHKFPIDPIQTNCMQTMPIITVDLGGHRVTYGSTHCSCSSKDYVPVTKHTEMPRHYVQYRHVPERAIQNYICFIRIASSESSSLTPSVKCDCGYRPYSSPTIHAENKGLFNECRLTKLVILLWKLNY